MCIDQGPSRSVTSVLPALQDAMSGQQMEWSESQLAYVEE